MTQYKTTNEEFYSIIEYWLVEWKFVVNYKDLSDPGDGPPTDVPKDQDEPKDLKVEGNSQDKASSATPIYLELEKQQQEV